MTTLFAFLHHLLAFVLVVLLAVELVLVRSPLTLENARKTCASNTNKLVKMRRIIHLELAGVVLILFFAAMAARGG